MSQPRRVPMALVGMGCRFPGGANSPDAYWRLLCDGVDAIREVPEGRFDLPEVFDPDPASPGKIYSRWGGFVDDIEGFDAGFFGIAPREAARVDPQQRMLLEVVWEALEDAGVPADRLAGSRTGVFVGISTHDYFDHQVNTSTRPWVDSHSATGTAMSIAANRVSYVYDLRGPSLSVDTACSSSLTALHLACLSLEAGDCDTAIVAGVNAYLRPDVAIGFCKASMLSPDGRCKAFDASANGFVRGEGAGAIVLKSLARALADGDRIHAVVRGTAANQDGRTVGISVPSADAQEALIREALQGAALRPADVQYVEAHGTGTRVGDPIEVSAIGRALAGSQPRAQRLLIGSAKTNIGHLEAAAGIAGVIKATLALEHRTIPPTLHLTTVNPAIPLDTLGIDIPTQLQPWPATTEATAARAGVNSFGFGGANAHVVLEAGPAAGAPTTATHPAFLLPISARHPDALRQLAGAWRDRLATENASATLADFCYTAAVRRSHHGQRATVVGASAEELVEQLDDLLDRNDAPAPRGGRGRTPKMAFVFTGMGPQWWAMGRQLLAEAPVFREAVEACDRSFGAPGGWSLLDTLMADEASSRVQDADRAVAINAAIQIGLVSLLRSWGVVPDAIVGHSAGEVAAAWASGALSLDDAMRLAYERGRLQARTRGQGTTLSVGIAEAEARALIEPVADRVAIAAVNSPSSVTLSGPRAALEPIAAALTAQQRFNRFLRVDVPYHAPPMDALKDDMLDVLAGLAPRTPTIPLVSTVTGTWTEGPLDAAYWFANLRQPVRFADAIDRLVEAEYELFVEIGPHPALSGAITECLAALRRSAVVVPTLRRHEGEQRNMMRALGALYTHGRDIDWATLYPTGHVVSTPAYPWQRERLWFDPGPQASRTTGIDSGHPLLGRRLPAMRPEWERDLGHGSLDYLQGHVVQGSPVYPAAAYIDTMLAACRQLAPGADPSVEHLTLPRALFTTRPSDTILRALVDPRTSSIEIHAATGDETWTLHAAARLPAGKGRVPPAPLALDQLRARCRDHVAVDDTYAALARRGLQYEGLFKGIRELWAGEGEALAHVEVPSGADTGYHVHPALLDSSFQVLLTAARTAAGASPVGAGLYLPVAVTRISLWQSPGVRAVAHATISRADADVIEGDITLVDEAGQVVMAIEGFRCKALEDAARSRRAALDALTYHIAWEPQALAPVTRRHVPVRRSAEIAARLEPTAHRMADERGWAVQLREADPLLDAIVAYYTRAALLGMGWDRRVPTAAEAAALADRLGVVQAHRRLFARLLEIVRDMPVEDVGDAAAARAQAEQLCARVVECVPSAGAHIELMQRSGERLGDILHGDVDAREVLFAPATLAAWARFFTELPWYEFYNTVAADAVADAVASVPEGACVRVLEIGAGTGGTTLSVLPRLAGRNVEYWFTDLSQYFLAQARERFADTPAVHVASLDIERDPVPQIGAEPFDVIVAANVIHATVDLAATMRHVHRLLAPGGALVLLETTRKASWTDIIFGITDGWWRFADLDLRPDHPLLSIPRWQAFLEGAGFSDPRGISERQDHGDPLQAVIVATRTATATAADGSAIDAQDWLVFADAGDVAARAVARLRAQGHRCVAVRSGEGWARADRDAFTVGSADVDGTALVLEQLAAERFAFDGVMHAWTLDAPAPDVLTADALLETQRHAVGSVLAFVQACERLGRPSPPLWLVTRGGQAVPGSDAGPDVAQVPLWGMGRVLMSELHEARIRLVDLPAVVTDAEVAALVEELAGGADEEEIALRPGGRHVARLRPARIAEMVAARPLEARAPDDHVFRLDVDTPGALESLVLREAPERAPGPGEVRIRVLAAGLNFRDVMLSLGMLPPMVTPDSGGRTILGFECAGVVIACGPGVTHVAPGDEVMAVSLASFASQVVTRAEMVVRKPAHLTFEEAATIPLVFVTAQYALVHQARLAPGERVLIHAATGGVGLAAVQIARRIGAEIFATAGSPEKRAHLQSLGIAHVMDSRSLAFADEILAATGGEGVDVVLNSLAGDAIPRGLSILRAYGRFLELGKRDIFADASIGLLPFDRNLAFCSIALEKMCVDRPAYVGQMLQEIADLLERRELAPIPCTARDLAEAEQAFRQLAQARHIGKLVLTVAQPSYRVAPARRRRVCRPDATYVITGGLGGLGLLVAEWLVARGATHVALVGRRDVPLPVNAPALARLQSSGATVAILKADVGRADDVARVFEEIRRTLPPVGGVFHAAMVLDDVLLTRMGLSRFEAAFTPKAVGAWLLHQATLGDDLDFFVLCSSVTAQLGSRGQGNYGAGNLFLDALAPYRHALGLPALTINWGALAEVGHVAQHAEVEQQLGRHGLLYLSPTEALDGLEEGILSGVANLTVARIDWSRWASVNANAAAIKKTRRLAHFDVARNGDSDAPNETSGVLASLAGVAPGERLEAVAQHVATLVARVLGTSARRIDADLPLTEMGIDSLMAVELQTVMERDFGTAPPLAAVLQGASIRQLSTTLHGALQLDARPPASGARAPDAATTDEQSPEASAAGATPSGSSGSLDARLPIAAAPVPPASAPEIQPAVAPSSAADPLTAPPVAAGSGTPDDVDYGAIDYAHWTVSQRVARGVIGSLFRTLAPIEVTGLERIPRDGAVIIAVNHLSMLDVAVLLTVLPRRGVCLATDNLRQYPWLRWFLAIGQTIYVRRGEADREALAKGRAVLGAGGLLGLAPEGTRSKTGGLLRGQVGAAWLAAEASAPIVPVAVWGQERIGRNLRRLRRTRVHVCVGEPVAVALGERTATVLQEATERVMLALARMLPEKYRGVYADRA